jgi:hypothetical protein
VAAFQINQYDAFILYPALSTISDVVLGDRPWPRGSSRTKNHVLGLGLGLESPGLGLGLKDPGLVLGLGLEGSGLDYMHVKFIF